MHLIIVLYLELFKKFLPYLLDIEPKIFTDELIGLSGLCLEVIEEEKVGKVGVATG